MKDLRKILNLEWGNYFYTDGRIIVIDEEISKETYNELSSLATKDGTEIVLIETSEMAGTLEKLVEKLLNEISATKEETLFVFPGEGAQKVKKMSVIWRSFRATDVYAKRFWTPGTAPYAVVGEISLEPSLRKNIKNVIAIDDVISSGQTLIKLKEKNSGRFPDARWYAGTWISQVPTKELKRAYVKIFSAILVRGPKGRVPINSLSSFLKYPEIASSYGERHLKDPERFKEILASITLEQKGIG